MKPNTGRCHLETCGCNDWAVIGLDDATHSTHYDKTVADPVAEALNARRGRANRRLGP